jgi:hypothetical protein
LTNAALIDRGLLKLALERAREFSELSSLDPSSIETTLIDEKFPRFAAKVVELLDSLRKATSNNSHRLSDPVNGS